MRRYWVIALAVLTLLGVLSPPAFAQAPTAPAPKVTITGLIDNLVNYNRNLSFSDASAVGGGITKPSDAETYGRTRGRFDIIGELGKAKAVLGLELDLTYGQTGFNENSGVGQFGFQKLAQDGGFDADNDVKGVIEIKWMYVEFPFSGPGSLLPFIPWAGTMTVGGQPYALGLKPSILADSDFGGATLRMTLSPTFNFSLTYAQLEEASVGNRANVAPGAAGATFAGQPSFGRGDDWGAIFKANYQATKELTVSPIYAFQEIAGTTSALLRRATGGYGVGAANFAPDQAAGVFGPPTTTNITPCLGTPAANVKCRPTEESRHWIGVDARWASGPWYVAPTAFYQFGSRERFQTAGEPGANAGALKRKTADISAWIADVEAGYRAGPLLLQLRAMYTSGNKPEDNLNKEIGYYQTFQTGNSYYAGWGEAHGIGNIDYLTSLYSFSNALAEPANIGYDRYGRAQFTAKATYDWTPQFSIYASVTPMWTARQVPTNNGVLTAGGIVCNQEDPTGLTAAGVVTPCTRRDSGNESYLGTDLTAGFTWRFAPGLTFDWVYGILVAGPAYDTNRFATVTGGAAGAAPAGVAGTVRKFDSENAYTTAARVRYAF